MKSQCKHCGTEFAVGTEPWLRQQEHCTKHDVVHVSGTECTSCIAERDDSLARDEQVDAEASQGQSEASDAEISYRGFFSTPASDEEGQRGNE